MILAYHGIETSEAGLALAAKMEEGGVDIEELSRVARRFGLRAEVRELKEDALFDLIAKQQWAILYFNRFPLDKQFAIHSVIPIRMTRHYIRVLDPRKGEIRVSRRKFDEARRYLGWFGVVCDYSEKENKAKVSKLDSRNR
jgi:ABC-type bacteriocin/lantibiotic exporter with double-glycine peptidase domain